MSVDVLWMNAEKTIILCTYGRSVRWEQVLEAQKGIRRLVESVSHRVHVIIDYGRMIQLPPNLLNHFAQPAYQRPTNEGLVILIGGDSFSKAVIASLLKQYPRLSDYVVYANSLEEAQHLISREARLQEVAALTQR